MPQENPSVMTDSAFQAYVDKISNLETGHDRPINLGHEIGDHWIPQQSSAEAGFGDRGLHCSYDPC